MILHLRQGVRFARLNFSFSEQLKTASVSILVFHPDSLFIDPVMNQQNLNLLVWSCALPGHEHETWEDAELCHELQASVTRLEQAALQLLVTSLSLLTSVQQQLPALSQTVEATRIELYQRLRARYETAGEPFGQNDESMWHWLQMAISQ